MEAVNGCRLLALLAMAACGSTPIDGPFERGVRAHTTGELRDAVDQYRKAVASNPGDEDAWFNLGVAWHELGNAAAARAAYEEAIAINPRAADAMCNLALVLRESDEKAAREWLQRAVGAAPHRAFPLVLLARMTPADAPSLLSKAIEREPGSAIAHLEAGRRAREDEDLPRALGHTEKAFAADGDSGAAARLLAEVALAAGRSERAVIAARRLASLHADSADAFALLARAYLARGFLPQALQAALQARDLAPEEKGYAALVRELLEALR